MKKSKKYYFFSVIVMCVSLIICVSAANATVDGISEADTPISDASMVLTSIDPINVDQGYENGDVSNNYAKLFNETSINLKRVNGCAPLHYAAYFNHLDLLKGILKGNPDINALSNDGFTPLFIASEYGYVDIVNELLKAGANQEIADSTGFRPLHIAAANDRNDVLLALIDLAEIDAQTYNGDTALHLALELDNVDTAKLLIQKGADLLKEDIAGVTPLMAICYSKNEKLWFLAINANVSPEMRRSFEPIFASSKFAGSKNIDIIKALLDNGMDIDIRLDDGLTPLHNACLMNLLDLAEDLIVRGASLEVIDDFGKKPMEYLNLSQSAYMHYIQRELQISRGQAVEPVLPDFPCLYESAKLCRTILKEAENLWKVANNDTLEPRSFVPTKEEEFKLINSIIEQSMINEAVNFSSIIYFLNELKIFKDPCNIKYLDFMSQVSTNSINGI